MPLIGYHASHEQFHPADLLRYVQRAERAGFGAAMCSDHFHPWSERQGESGFAWSWLGAAMATTSLSFGTVNAPGQRYHPAIIAQAAATLGAMFPGRFWVALGSGEALNESITGDPWPDKAERNARLRESADVIRALLAGETVTHRGRVIVEEARLHTRPETPPSLIAAALSAETAAWAAQWADGLITVAAPPEDLREIVAAFRGSGGRDKPMYLQVGLSFAANDAEALEAAHREWRTNVLPGDLLANLASPAAFDAAAAPVSPDEVARRVRVSADPRCHADWLAADLELGFERVYLHNVHRDQERFIDAFGDRVLPELAR
jgi:probable non-F420 flavinoid oxidoreductase